MEIHCLKIHQLILPGVHKHKFHYFPYDRVYFIPRKKAGLTKRLFRYCLIMNVDSHIRAALENLYIPQQRRIDLEPAPWPNQSKNLEWVEADDPLQFLKQGKWIMVVPTFTRTKRPSNIPKSELVYILTKAISGMHNMDVLLPSIQLQTPNKTIPVMCSLCTKLPDYHANECTPGRFVCKMNADFSGLPIDKIFKEHRQKSINGGGSTK